MRDKVLLGNDNYEVFSGGLLGQERGIVRWKDGVMQAPAWGKLETWIKDSVYDAGMNAFGMLTYSPWESKGHADLLCPFKWNEAKGKWSLTEIDPTWLSVFDEAVAQIMRLTEPVADNFKLQVLLFCEPWFHWNTPNPWANNTQGYHDFYDVPIPMLRPYIDAVMGVLAKYPGRTQVIIGCEMTVRPGSPVKWYNPKGIIEPVAVVREAIWMHQVSLYLLGKYKLDPAEMSWGAALGNVAQNEKGEYYIVDDHTSLALEIERITGRMNHKVWDKIHIEMHGACGNWTPTEPSFFSKVAAQFFGTGNSRTAHLSTDGDNAKKTGPEYASIWDRQPLYWRYNGTATRSTFAYAIRHCIKKATMAQRFVAAVKRMVGLTPSYSMLWCSVLPQTWDTLKVWYLENAEALAEAYIDATGKRPYNLSKEPPVEPVPVPEPTPGPAPVPAPTGEDWRGWWRNNGKWFVVAIVLALLALAIFA